MRLAFQTSISAMERHDSAEDHSGRGADVAGGAACAAEGGSASDGRGGAGQGVQARLKSRAPTTTAAARGVVAALLVLALVPAIVLAWSASAIAAPDAAQDPEAREPAGEKRTPDRAAAAQRLRPVLGEPHHDLILDGDTLLDVAFRNRIGIEPLARLNPEVDIWIPPTGAIVRLPSPIVLPDAPAEGLVINIPEMRLFDFSTEGEPEVFSAAIGDLEDPTPTGEYAIRGKRVDPAWNVPESIRDEKPDLPEVVPAGPDNPLGSRWMRIGSTSYGIHGTNMRWSIGRRATHGCVRLYESDMRTLFDRTPEGTPIRLIYQPYKWGRQGTDLLLEAHPDIYERFPDRLAAALAPLRELRLLEYVDLERAWHTVDAARGVPVVVGRLPDDLDR